MNAIGRLLDPQTVEALNHLAISARRVVEGNTVGLHRSPVKGASVEFRQHRLYVPGDEPRRIDWRVLARSDKAFVKEFDEETNLRGVAVLDSSGSMAYGERPGKFAYASRLVAGLCYLMLAQTESAGLRICREEKDDWVPPGSSSTQLSRIIDLLESAEPRGINALPASLRVTAERIDRRALILIASDFLTPIDQLRTGLSRLHHDRHEIVLIRVLHPHEITFPFRSWAQFKGLEGETPRLLEAPSVRKKYLANFQRHADELSAAARALDADLVVCRTDAPVVDSIGSVIRRGRR